MKFIREMKYYIIIFSVIMIFLGNSIIANLRLGRKTKNVIVYINTTQQDNSKIDVLKISPSGKVNNLVYNKKENFFYYSSPGYFKNIQIKIRDELTEYLDSVLVVIGQKRFSFSKKEIYSTWKIQSKDQFDLLIVPESVKYKNSLLPVFNNIINWPGDFSVCIDLCYPYLLILVLFFILLFFINRYISFKVPGNLKNQDLYIKLYNWKNTEKSNLLKYNLIFILIVFVLATIGLILRLILNKLPYLGGDSGGYFGSAIYFFDTGEFKHVSSRSFPYPLFVLFVLKLFNDFSYITIIQHIIGVTTGLLIIYSVKLFYKLFKIDDKYSILFDLFGLLIGSVYLFSESIIAVEHYLLRESIYPFLLIFIVFALLKIIIKIQGQDKSSKIFLWMNIFFILNYFIFVFQPRWGFTLIFNIFIYAAFVIFIKLNIIKKIVLLVILPVLLSFVFVYTPENILIKNKTVTQSFLPMHLFFGHAKIIDKELEKDINDPEFNKYDKKLLIKVRQAFKEEFNKPQTKHKFLGYHFNRMVYSGWINDYVKSKLAKNEYKKFCLYYFLRSVFKHPFMYAKKIILELTQFYNFYGGMYEYRLYKNDYIIYSDSYERIKNKTSNYLPFIEFKNILFHTKNSKYNINKISIYYPGIIVFLLSKSYLISLTLFIILFILNFINYLKKIIPVNHGLFLTGIFIIILYMYNFFTNFTIASVYTFDVTRYIEDQFLITLLSQVFGIFYIIRMVYGIIKNKHIIFKKKN